MSNVIQITSNNFNGQYADITFYPCSGGSINLGYQLLPYDYAQDNYEGTYDIYVSAYTLTCQLVIACPSPTPTSTTTPTITPTMTVTPTNTVTPTPSYFSYSGLFYSGLTACDACALTSSTVTLYWDINYGPTLQVGEYVWLNPGPAFGGFVPNGYYILSTDTNNYFGISAGSQVYEISGCTVCTPTPTPTPTITPSVTPTPTPTITPSPSPSVFTPASISNLVGWFDAAQGVNVTGSDVNSWQDLSSTMGNFTYSFGTKAVLYNSGFGTNNLPYIKGASIGSDYITASNWPSTSTSTVYIVYRPYQSVGGAYQGYMEQSAYGTGFIFLDADSSPTDGISVGFTSSLVPSLYPTVNTPSIIRVKWDGSNNLVKLNNGSEVNTGSALSSQPSNPLHLFNRANTNFGIGFDAAEIIIYNKVLSAGEITQIEAYLTNKYGITL